MPIRRPPVLSRRLGPKNFKPIWQCGAADATDGGYTGARDRRGDTRRRMNLPGLLPVTRSVSVPPPRGGGSMDDRGMFLDRQLVLCDMP